MKTEPPSRPSRLDRFVEWVCHKSDHGPFRWLFIPLALLVIVLVILTDPKHYTEEL